MKIATLFCFFLFFTGPWSAGTPPTLVDEEILLHTTDPMTFDSFSPLRLAGVDEWRAVLTEVDRARDLNPWPSDLSPKAEIGILRSFSPARIIICERTDTGLTLRVDANGDGAIEPSEIFALQGADDAWLRGTVEVDGWPVGFGIPKSALSGRLYVFHRTLRKSSFFLDDYLIEVAVAGFPDAFDAPSAVVYFDVNLDGRLELGANSAERSRLENSPVDVLGTKIQVTVNSDGSEIRLRAVGGSDYVAPVAGSTNRGEEFLDLEGNPTSLNSFLGQPLLIHTWGSWCGPCRKQFPALKSLANEFSSQGLGILGINIGDPISVALEYAKEQGLVWQHTAEGIDGNLLRNLNLQGTPSYVFIDQNGTIVERQIGPTELKELVRSTLATGETRLQPN